MKLTPAPDQEAAIATLAADDGAGAINGSDTGTGKTLVGIESALERYAKRVLIAAPLSTYDNWRDTLSGQTEGRATLLPVANSKISEDTTARECKENLRAMMAGEDGFYFISRELLVSLDWYTHNDRRKQRYAYRKYPFDVFIGDEAHAWCNPKSRGFKTFKGIVADYKIAASATWFGSNFENARTLPLGIWGDELTDTAALWKARWCSTKFSPHTYDRLEVTGELNPGAWAAALPTFIQLRSDIKNPVPEIRWVDLSVAERKVYDAIDRDMVAKVESGEWIAADSAMVAHMRLRQATLGPLDVVDEEVVYRPDGKSSKYAELKRSLAEHNEPALVVTDSAKYAEVLTAWLQHDGYTAGLWAGLSRTSATKRDQLKASFLAGNTRVIVMVIAAGGTGTDGIQHACRRMVIMSDDQSETRRHQVFGRIARKGQKRPVIVEAIYARHTIDAGVGATLIQRALDNAASRKHNCGQPHSQLDNESRTSWLGRGSFWPSTDSWLDGKLRHA